MRWIARFFNTTDVLCLSPAGYSSPSDEAREKFSLPAEEATFYNYLYERRFVSSGYKKIIFNEFDFTDLQLKDILSLVSVLKNSLIFVDAIFTLSQIHFLISENYDLTECNYTTPPMPLEQCIALYERQANQKTRAQWHGVKADFSDQDIRALNCDFIVFYDDPLLHNASFTQEQFNSILRKRDEKILKRYANHHISTYNKNRVSPLNLTEVSLADLDISDLLKNDYQSTQRKFDSLDKTQLPLIEHHVIYFDKNNNRNGICLADTGINNAIIHIDCFAFLATTEKYHHWFATVSAEFNFTLRCDDGLLNEDFAINIDVCFTKLIELHKAPLTARGAMRQFPIHCDVFGELKILLKEFDKSFDALDINTMPNGLKFLWLMYYIQHKPESRLAGVFWKTLRTTQQNCPQPTCPFEV